MSIDIHFLNKDYALRWAAWFGHTQTVKALLEAGADIHVCGDDVLHWASKNGHTQTVKLIQSYMK